MLIKAFYITLILMSASSSREPKKLVSILTYVVATPLLLPMLNHQPILRCFLYKVIDTALTFSIIIFAC